MYVVNLQYFDRNGYFLGEGCAYSPGKDPRAIREFIKEQTIPLVCGWKPEYVYAYPETGEPTIIHLGG